MEHDQPNTAHDGGQPPIPQSDIDEFLSGITDPTPDAATPRSDPDTLTTYSLVGREGGAANGELDQTTVGSIIADPAKYGCDGQWRTMKHGCPFAHGGVHAKGESVSFMVSGGKFVLTCYGKHAHPGGAQKQASNGRTYHVYTVQAAPGQSRQRFPPFTSTSDVHIARVLLSTVLAGAEYSSRTSIRKYDGDVGDVNAAHKKGARRASRTAGKWVLWTSDLIDRLIQSLDGEWVVTGQDGDGNPKYRRIELSAGKVEGIRKTILSMVAGQRQLDPDGQGFDGEPVSRFDTPARPCIPVRGAIYDLTEERFVFPTEQDVSRSFYVRAEDTIEVDPWPIVERTHDLVTGERIEPYRHHDVPFPTRFVSMLETMWGRSPDFIARMAFLQQWMGVALAGETCIAAKHIILRGPTQRGKSQILNVVEKMFPARSRIAVSPTDLNGNFSLGPFASARINVVAEVSPGKMANATVLKELTAGDRVRAERKYHDAVYIRPRCAWIMSCNDNWRPDERDASVFRRFEVLTFDHDIPKSQVVQNLGEIIAATELRSIVWWAAMGYSTYRSMGRQFTQVPSSAVAIHEWRRDVDTTVRWIEECVQATNDRDRWVAPREAYAAYREWCQGLGYREPVAEARLAKSMRDAGLVQTSSVVGRGGKKGRWWAVAIEGSGSVFDDPNVESIH